MGKIRKLMRNPVGFLIDSRFSNLASLGNLIERDLRRRFKAAGKAAADQTVGIIMTAYNTGSHLKASVDSVLAQSHDNLELWILDDASTDNTPDILAALAKSESRVRAFRSPSNHGTYWSKNWCLKHIATPYVTFHDSDDRSYAHRIRQQLGALTYFPNALACAARWHRVNDRGEIINIDGENERMAAISLMMKRQTIVDSVGYFDTVRISADTEYLDRIRLIHGRMALYPIREVLYEGLIRSDSLTRGPDSGFTWTGDEAAQKRTLSGDRLTYHEAFKAWHKGLGLNKKDRRFDFPQTKRSFPAPSSILKGCDDADISQVISL